MTAIKKTISIEDHIDLDNAWTIPAEYYTSEELFEVEKEKVFANTWICVAHISELAEKNDYVIREIIGESLIIVRGRDNVLRGFYNVCPHRGHQLMSGEGGKAKNVITCPYHAWAFKLDGELAHATNCENVANFDASAMSLSSFHVTEYAGFIYINLTRDEPQPIEEQLPGLKEQMEQACPVIKELKLAARFVNPTAANWKTIVDNYIECYHCPTNHVSFASSVDVGVYEHNLYDNWTVQIGQAKPSESSYQFDESVKDPKFYGFWVWPCTMFNMPPGGDFMTVIYEFPVSAGETLQYYDIYFLNEELTEYQKNLIEWYRTVFRPEDLRLVEGVQKGLQSRGYRGQGRIMTDRQRSGISEHGVAHFHQHVARAHQE
ncbi:ring-hydroxylating oxygenase subunit alpha [Ignatzschineria indica]|uniref:Carnitine monooxygenase oxygenase subunit n=1 Tax=Ignatzschineria indica TaxID=472583 RepID=A0A2U2AP97_9GAMM|nr:ring-hydroxylating oxygenase subunit alpha [Ignatzschineria indica]PWD84997.1 ring-hydroxylating oxygenase subunit alpha [Ignatzschineria indica]GGZ80717.1 ring-hydroxylating oxygenase subunit alpha [Ignatzschineria indica]